MYSIELPCLVTEVGAQGPHQDAVNWNAQKGIQNADDFAQVRRGWQVTITWKKKKAINAKMHHIPMHRNNVMAWRQ